MAHRSRAGTVQAEPLRPSTDLPLIFPEDVEAAAKAPLRGADPSPPVPEPDVGEPEPVVTETMADLYERQGHLAEALRVYRLLGDRHPDNARFREKISLLEMSLQTPDAVTTRWPLYAASVTGGESVESFFRALLAERLTPLGAEDHAAVITGSSAEAGDGVDDLSPGAPTRPAKDHLSLSAIFGEEGAAAPVAVPPTGDPGSAPAAAPATGGFSFDEFFGGKQSAGSQASQVAGARGARPSGLEEDLDQFQNWLKGLKR